VRLLDALDERGTRMAIVSSSANAPDVLRAAGLLDRFETVVDGVSVNGIDLIRTNDSGLISELTVMVRPLSAANALATAMGAQFDQIVAEASGASS